MSKKELDRLYFGHSDTPDYYHQTKYGLYDYRSRNIGNIYIYQIKVIRDIKDRYEPLYTLKYEDMVFNEIKTVKNRTFEELVNYLVKQQLIIDKKDCLEFIIAYSINFYHDMKLNGIPFVVKEKHDFTNKNLTKKWM